MQPSIPTEMLAAAIDRFGGPEELYAERLPVPKPKADEVLIHLDAAGIGVWDKWIRTGEFSLGKSGFPMIMGNDGAGEVVGVGEKVTDFQPGDRVYAYSMEGGFYAQYASVKQAFVAKLPKGLSPEQAGALGADGITALRGLDDTLELRAGQSLLIFGASGGIGHLAVQLAKRMGAKVIAVASGDDGVQLAKRLGADVAIDGKKDDIVGALKAFAPDGLDAALVLTGGRELDAALKQVKQSGRFAYPNGVEPEPKAPAGVHGGAYDGVPDRAAFQKLNALIDKAPFHVEVRSYALKDAAQAHRDVEKHHLGKLALKMN